MSVYNFGGTGCNLTKLYQGTWREARVFKWTLILQGVSPTKFGRAKNVQNPARFLTTFEFDREYLLNRPTHRKSEKYSINYISSSIGRKNLVNFGPLTRKLSTLMSTHPSGLLSEYQISATRWCWTLKFLHTADIGQGLLARTTNRVGGPPKF